MNKASILKALKGAKASVSITAEGFHDHYETCPNDVNAAAKEYGLDVDYREDADHTDSDYGPDIWERGVTAGRNYETVDASGILPLADALRAVYRSGGWGDSTPTMGTIGGPLGGIVPDVSFEVESRCAAFCIRVTPFVEGKRGLLDRCKALRALMELAGEDPDTAADILTNA